MTNNVFGIYESVQSLQGLGQHVGMSGPGDSNALLYN
jgi:hypothetical protein